jgi:hypothetical protein
MMPGLEQGNPKNRKSGSGKENNEEGRSGSGKENNKEGRVDASKLDRSFYD